MEQCLASVHHDPCASRPAASVKSPVDSPVAIPRRVGGLRATGETTRKRDPSAPELSITTLRKMFTKLGITSRTGPGPPANHPAQDRLNTETGDLADAKHAPLAGSSGHATTDRRGTQ